MHPQTPSRDDLIRKAVFLFWRKGFFDTSMRDIQATLNLRPGSIYGRFGSKDGLFLEVLHSYAAENQTYLQVSVAMAETPMAGLKQYMKDLVIGSRHSAPSCLCLLVKTVSELTEEQGELLAEAKRLLAEVQNGFAEILEAAQACGGLESSVDVIRAAKYLQVQQMGLRTYARTDVTDSELEEMISAVFRNLPMQTA